MLNMESPWKILSREAKEPEGVLTDRFIMKYALKMDWDLLSENYKFSEGMLRIFQHRVNWALVLKKQKFTESFLREMVPYFSDCWDVVSKYQKLSQQFIHDYADKVDWEVVVLYQTMSAKFYAEHRQYTEP